VKKVVSCLSILTLLTLIGCTSDTQNNIVSQKYIHKYGFDLTEKEWDDREKDGQIVTIYKDGTKLAQNFSNGILHGSALTTYPHSEIVKNEKIYDQGTLLKEIINDENGIPIREDAFEFDNRKIITLWYESGSPMSIEEYNSNKLIEASYFSATNELEASVENYKGTRIKRDRAGKILNEDEIEDGIVAIRKTFHPNSQLQSITRFKNYELNGLQKKYTVSGKPLMEQTYKDGLLDGNQIHYRNGKVVLEIPFVNGKRHGIERQYDLDGSLIAEIPWEFDEKHGRERIKHEDYSNLEWFFRGKSVTREEYNELDTREKILAELSLENND
jgi:antitoxin component YwqK of YwqJK toxin-antitoxin module